MRKRANQRLDIIFGALSDPIRRTIVGRLSRGECSITTLAEPFNVTAPAITKHLRVLESSGLITRRKEGRVNYCRLSETPLREAEDWIQQQRAFWEQQLNALDRFLEKEKGVWPDPQSDEPELRSGSRGASTHRAKKSSTSGRSP